VPFKCEHVLAGVCVPDLEVNIQVGVGSRLHVHLPVNWAAVCSPCKCGHMTQ
jgi:hypothetical protein